MSRVFESFEYLDRGWDVRALENCSLRRAFVMLLLLASVLGAELGVTAYAAFLFRRFIWSEVFNLLAVGLAAFRYSRAVYRRLDR